MSESQSQTRRRWITFGEIVAVAALLVSAFGVWIAWKSSSEDKPTRVVEQKQAIPLTLRGTAQHDGRELVIAPVEPAHALESLTLDIKGAYPIELGSDGVLAADYVEPKLDAKHKDKDARSIPVQIEAQYVEMGKDRRASGSYVLRYRWEGGGLLGGRSLRLISLSRG